MRTELKLAAVVLVSTGMTVASVKWGERRADERREAELREAAIAAVVSGHPHGDPVLHLDCKLCGNTLAEFVAGSDEHEPPVVRLSRLHALLAHAAPVTSSGTSPEGKK